MYFCAPSLEVSKSGQLLHEYPLFEGCAVSWASSLRNIPASAWYAAVPLKQGATEIVPCVLERYNTPIFA